VPELPGAKAMLVRPDGYVCWVSDTDLELETALHTWFGAQ
jgi:hypothetical protein